MGNLFCQYNNFQERDTEVSNTTHVETAQDLKLAANDFIIFFQQHKFLDHYDIDAQLGEGAFGQVYRCIQKKTNIVRAVKTILKSSFMNESDKQKFLSEIIILKQMDHPNIIKLYEVFQDDARYYIVTELLNGGELFDEIINRKRFTEKDAAEIMYQILSAISYCHANNICHRDLKPENILIESKGRVKIIDFGTAQAFNPQKGMNNILGTPYYMAPEIFNNSFYNEKCDIWSIGAILYILLTGQPPFYGKTDEEIIMRVRKGVYPKNVLIEKGISEEAQDLIQKLLTFQFDQRINAQEAISHEWIQKKGVRDTDLFQAKQALENLSHFHTEQKLQQAVLTYIVSQLISNEEIQNIKDIFLAFDTNKDGKLQKQEIVEGYKKIYGEFAEEEVEKIITMADMDGNGEIEYSEWLIATLNMNNLITEDKLKHAFGFFDKDKNGFISIQELQEVLGSKSQLIDDKVWNEIIKEADISGDGQISFEEFKEMMMNLIKNQIENNVALTSKSTLAF